MAGNKVAQRGTPLTPREVQIFDLVFRGMTNQRIGDKLGLSPMTIKNHLEKLYRKLGVKYGCDARINSIFVGLEKGVLVPPPVVFDPAYTPSSFIAPETESLPDSADHIKVDDWIRFRNIIISGNCRAACVDSKIIRMLDREFDLLLVFMRKPNHIMNRNHLLDLVWGTGVAVEDRTVDVHVHRLRAILRRSGAKGDVFTVIGYGYKFVALDDPSVQPWKREV